MVWHLITTKEMLLQKDTFDAFSVYLCDIGSGFSWNSEASTLEFQGIVL